jgi:hypothetical protein
MNDSNLPDLTETGVAHPTTPIKSSKVGVKLKGKILFFDAADLTAIEAQGNYILLRRESSSYRLRESISGGGKAEATWFYSNPPVGVGECLLCGRDSATIDWTIQPSS